MPDVFAALDCADDEVVDRLAGMLEARGVESCQCRMRSDYLGRIRFPDGARVLEIGCGTGVIAREVARYPGVSWVLGLDNCGRLIERARAADPGGRYDCADVRELPLPDACVDVVIAHTLFSHLPQPKQALAEAARVLAPGGQLVVFDGDYSSVTSGPVLVDPLAQCVAAWRDAYVFDPNIRERLADLARAVGFVQLAEVTYRYAPSDPGYLFSIIDRGADALIGSGTVGAALGGALKDEARHRVATDRFGASLDYFLLTAARP